MKNKIIYLLLISVSVLLYSCSESLTDNLTKNSDPDTFLFLKPESDISKQSSRLAVNWWGDDPDGMLAGFFFKWEGIDNNWHFTSRNDSTFNLPIGTVDTSFVFKIAAADNDGNGVFDAKVIRGGVDYGSEPFVDADKNGVYSPGEKFIDIGNIDPTPAMLKFPIKNSSPVLKWVDNFAMPDTSLPVMTFAWNASDLDGDNTITKINIALNDTTKYISLPGNARLITIRTKDFNSAAPVMDILINGSENNIYQTKLQGLKLNSVNRIYIQAEDIAGAKSSFVSMPDKEKNWYVKKPKGKLLIVDDYYLTDLASDKKVTDFYYNAFNSTNGGSLRDKYEVMDLGRSNLPYKNITIYETMKLFGFVYWYSNSRPSIDLTSAMTNKYINQGGKIAFSMTVEETNKDFSFTAADLQTFLPIDSLGQKKSLNFMFPGAKLNPAAGSSYPALTTATTISSVRTFIQSDLAATKIYELSSSQIKGPISFMTNDKKMFFIGLPLHQCDGGEGNVKKLLQKIFFEEFGLTL